MPMALLALAISAFGIGTTEFVMMGLLPNVADDMGTSVPTAGYLVSAYAIGVVIGAPLLTAVGARVPRKRMLVLLMGLFTVGNLASALEVTPAGKSTRRLSLLSGGEKSLVALAFVFAVLMARPCPFYILDEVEAALDDINIDRFLRLVRRFAERSQFIVVTHQKRTMDAADILYGVSMGGDGITKVVSRKLPRDELETLPGEPEATEEAAEAAA